MEDNKIRIGITQGDINGVGYEVILKTFSDPTMLELCTPIIYGSPKVAAYHRKALDIQANFSIVNSATEAGYNRLSVVNCTDDEVKVEFSKPDPEAGKAALGALERAIEEYREGLIDVIVTAPINKHTIQSEEFSFPGHTEYIEERLGNGDKSLMILMKNDFRVALVTTHCGAFSQSSCRRRWFVGNGRAGSDYPCHERNGRERNPLLRSLCGRRLYGFGQLYSF